MNIEIKNEVVFKDGEQIGIIAGSECTLTAKVGPTVKAAINSAYGSKLTYRVGEAPDVGDEPELEPKETGIEAKLKAGEIPSPPEKHPAMGDKTPAFVAWFKKHATPDEFAKRYPDTRRLPDNLDAFQDGERKKQSKLPGEVKDDAE